MPTFSLPQPVPPPKKSETSSDPADTPTGARPTSYDDAFRGREAHSKFADPCAQAREESMKCLDRHSYDKPKCTEFFQAYRDCKKEWLNQRREDRRAGKNVA
ncbi:hypothetical protein JCM3765_007268 [Sporobolomyces pararoseus]